MTVTEINNQLLTNCVNKNREIKTKCSYCFKTFWVSVGTIAIAIKRHEPCRCSACGNRTLETVKL